MTAKAFVPDDKLALPGSAAAPSVEDMATVGLDVVTTFQLASTAFTVALTLVPAVTAVGVPVLPDAVPGAAVSPGSKTCSFVAEPAPTVNPAEAPVSDPPDVRVAVNVWPSPARVNVTECDAITPAVNAAVVPPPAPKSDVDVKSTVPVKFNTVRFPESCAVTLIANGVPAVWVPIALPLVSVTANLARAPNGTTAADAFEATEFPLALVATTVNV